MKDYSQLYEYRNILESAYDEGYQQGYEDGQKEKQKVKEEIKVGDEVKDLVYGERGIVLQYNPDADCAWVINGSRSLRCGINEFVKTGRHFPQIKEVLDQLKGEDHDL